MRTVVLVPVGGFAPYLPEALDSVLDQVPAGDVVVVEDGMDPPVPWDDLPYDVARGGWDDRRRGPAAARAEGLELAELSAATTWTAHEPRDADLVALCDADDAWLPGKLAAQVAALEADPGAGLAFGRAEVVGPDGRPTGEAWEAPPAGPLDPAALYRRNPIPTSSVVLRRDVLEAAGGFAAPTLVAEDWDLWLRVAATGARLLCVPEARIAYRRHPSSLTADVGRLAQAQLELHERHGDLVDAATRDGVLAADRAAVRRARLRARVPVLGARDPYRRG